MSSRLSFSLWANVVICIATSITAIAAKQAGAVEELGHESTAKLKILSAAIAKKPQDADPYLDRGLFYLAADEDEKALADFNRGVALNTNACKAYYCRGDYFMRTEEFGKASNDYVKSGDAAAVASVKGLAYQQAGRALLKSGKYTDSLALLTKALSLADDSRKPLILLNRAETYLTLKQYAATVADLDAIPPTAKVPQETAHGLKARALMALGKYEQAIPEYSATIKLSALHPNSLTAVIFSTNTANYLKERAFCFDKIGKKDLAALDRRKAERVQEDSLQFAPFR